MSEEVQQVGRPARRGAVTRRTAVLWAVAAGAALLGAGAQTWVQASGLDGLSETSVDATGNDAAAVVPAMALVGMAGGAALSIARRVARTVIAALLVLAGLAGAVASVQVAANPAEAAQSVVGSATGTTALASEYVVTVWPWIALAVSVALALCGVAVLVFGRQWALTSRRYDTGSSADPSSASRHQDGPARTQQSRPDEDLDEIDAWDQLSRGNDPT